PLSPTPCSTFSRTLLSCPPPPHSLPSFPTRRSSDLSIGASPVDPATTIPRSPCARCARTLCSNPWRSSSPVAPNGVVTGAKIPRSEEHTSELQSRVDLVCRLLLEKKKEQ